VADPRRCPVALPPAPPPPPPNPLSPLPLFLYPQSNHAVPLRRGMTVLGSVVDVDDTSVAFATGHRGITRVARADVGLSSLLGTTEAGLARARATPWHLARGDVAELVVLRRAGETPHDGVRGGGRTPWLDSTHRDASPLIPAVWRELRRAHRRRLLVPGRVLGPVTGDRGGGGGGPGGRGGRVGWAVGFGGIAGFLPEAAAGDAPRALGALRPFRILKAEGGPWDATLTVADPSASPRGGRA